MIDLQDVIAAIATGPEPALRGVVRLSGSGLDEVLHRAAIVGSVDSHGVASSREICLCLPEPWPQVNARLYLWPDTRSYTGQPSAELQLPGSLPLLEAVLGWLLGFGARLARPGEFTLRAFLNGRIDLIQAEAVLEVIEAQDGPALQQGLNRLAGGVAQTLRALREDLLDLLADLEAGLDFVDEDIQFVTPEALIERLAEHSRTLRGMTEQFADRGQSDQRLRVVLTGLPNAGKSSLFNSLCGDQLAIVSPAARTTRDMLEGIWRVGGQSVWLHDTAGWVDSTDEVDRHARRAAEDAMLAADLRLLCIDASDERPLSDWERAAVQRATTHRNNTLLIATKCDCPSAARETDLADAIPTSSRTRAGIDALHRAVEACLLERAQRSPAAAATNARCGEALMQGMTQLANAEELAKEATGDELVAAELRAALLSIASVTGEVSTDDLLDRIFSRFCIGK
jgi:tRNA modification GTPase